MNWQTKFPEAALQIATFETSLSEQSTQQQCRAIAGHCNAFLGRNNTGAYSAKKPPTAGTRWGWCNDSAKTNAVFKTPDLIGYASVVIEPHHVGRTFAVFVGAEVKDPKWHRVPSDKRASAQDNCLSKIKQDGGIAAFITDVEQIPQLITEFIL